MTRTADRVTPDGEVWCRHRDISCCDACFNERADYVRVGGVVFECIPTELRDMVELALDPERVLPDGTPITEMSAAWYAAHPTHNNHTPKEGNVTTIENHEQYRNLLDALSVGDVLPDDTYEAMRAFAKAKKIKAPPANNEAKAPEPKKESTRTHNMGQLCSEAGCDREAQSLGLCKKHHTARWRKSPGGLEKSRRAARKHAAKKRYVDLVRLVGPGFHPDTRGADYTSLPEGITPERVDEVVKGALEYGLDVHGLALDAVHELQGASS